MSLTQVTAGFRNGVNIPVEYMYDANGNMVLDINKNQTIWYNHLNLVSKYPRSGGDIEFTYDALGKKLTHLQRRSNGTIDWAYQYAGPFLYSQSGHPCSGSSCLGSPTIQTAEGRIKPGTGGYSYQYDLKDHLGSVRMTFDKDPTTGLARIIQEDHYYAFGGKLAGRSYDFSNGNRYTYTGQEYLAEVDVYDHGARMYDHQLGRWHVIDPLAELYVGYSPYNYVLNNPISYLDPTGLGVEGWYMDENGQMQFNNDIHSQGDLRQNKIKGEYMFEEGYWEGNDGLQSYYGANGEDPIPVVGALGTLTLMGEKPQEGNHVWFSWAATSQPSAQQQNMYMMSDALANWSSNIILSAMGGYASSGLTSSMTMVRSLSGAAGKQVAAKESVKTFTNIGGRTNQEWAQLFQWGKGPQGAADKLATFSKTDVIRLKNAGVKLIDVKQWSKMYHEAINKGGGFNQTAVYRSDLMDAIINLW